jgi:dipeptidyl-peptidase III
MEANQILAENTRLVKKELEGGKLEFILLKASGTKKPQSDDEKLEYDLPDGNKLKIQYGDYEREMALIADSLEKAIPHAANEIQKNMLEEYVKSFRSGSLEAHKESQKYWVKDVGPKVEVNLGFIETYRDPAGVRGEWEGLVSTVNAEQTEKFGKLVSGAESFIPRLPWGKEFEKDHFSKPDFTSLEVLTFAGSGIPAGINIPNYDDIRQTIGFKNVSLGNVLSAKSPNEVITFIKDSDLELFKALRGPSFEVQVGLHELLGHGTGKLLQETEEGKYNFDVENPPISPITGERVKTWYKPGQTWGSVFGGIAASYEECRAECVAMFLGGDKDILEIFGYKEGGDINPEDGKLL